MNLSPLLCKIQSYAWGSRSFIATLQGRTTPSDGPEAELWVGAHPSAPAEVAEGEARYRLDELIAAAPDRALGVRVAQRFHGELPFLMKVLAAGEPLSLQAHPSSAQAEEGFAREEAAGVLIGAPDRSYKDARAKPELIVALTPFVALSGFRSLERTQHVVDALAVPELSALFAPSNQRERSSDAELRLARIFERLITSGATERDRLVRAVRARAAELAQTFTGFTRELAWVERLHALYPGDIGVVISLLLNLVELAPFQGLYLPAGNLHAYLDGAGVEVMANSDNVLRGGLTKKAINVPELLRILRFQELDVKPIDPTPASSQSAGIDELVYATPAEEFRLSTVRIDGLSQLPRSQGPELLLVTEGRIQIQRDLPSASYSLAAGDSAFVPACEGALRAAGQGTLFRATVPTA